MSALALRPPLIESAALDRARLIVLVLLGCLLLPNASAVAERTQRSPDAKELWQQYPLHQKPSAQADGTAVPSTSRTPVATPLKPAPTPSSDGTPLALVAIALVALASATFVIVRARRRPGEGGGLRRWLAGAARPLHHEPTFAAAAGLGVQMGGPDDAPPARLWRTSRHEEPMAGGAHGGPVPPDPDRAWSAEVEWEHAEGEGRFRVLARDKEDGSAVALAKSEPLEWPPRGPQSVQAMSRAADELESSLLAAGWKPLPPGEAWYAKRFAWARPIAAAPAPELAGVEEESDTKQRRRFRRVAWPEATEELYRCELEWRAGYVNSRFEAVVQPPGRKRGQAIGGSATFKWLLMGDPDATAAEYRGEVERLTAALESIGWERVPDGANWFSRRFVWRSDSPPPDRIEAGPSSSNAT